MRSSDDDDLGGNTVLTPDDAASDAERVGHLHLIVIGNGSFATHALSESGVITIGRSPKCDVTIDDPSISRRHAILTLGEQLTIEDLDSANGTRVRGRALALGHPAQIDVGELVGVGKVNLMLQQRALNMDSRQTLGSDQLEKRLGEECARTQRSGATFALLQIEPKQRAAAHLVEEALRELLRETDVLGKHLLHGFRVLLLDTPPANVDDAVRRIEGKLIQRGHQCKFLIASCPRDGVSARELIARLEHPLTAEPSVVPNGRAPNVIVSDPRMHDLYQMIQQVAGSTIGVLLLGETGVGKEVFARTLHRASRRASGPFIELNCAALTETLLESELFGHEKGAFTHATSAKPGLIEMAHGGTMFLDEVGDLPLSTQAKLLRIIEDSQLRRVGALKARPVDVRFVAATNIDLEARITAGTFRRDLFYRLNGVTLLIPPLRERTSEIGPLAEAFVARAWSGTGPLPELASETLEVLETYQWPGNVRELMHMIERAVLLCGPGPILPQHLPEKLRVLGSTPEPEPAAPAEPTLDEEQQIRRALDRSNGNQTLAARLLGISRRTLVNRLNAYGGIHRPRKGKKAEASD